MDLTSKAAPDAPDLADDVWPDVMRQVDAAYAELVAHQTALEAKNADLEAMRKFMESVLGAMSDALIVCDRLGSVQEVNPALRALADLGDADLSRARLEDLVAATDRDALRLALRAAEAASAGVVQELTLANGAAVEMRVAPRHDGRRRLVGFVLIGRPIGELRRAYRALEETHEQLKTAQSSLIHSEKMASLGRLVAGVAHELNNPISFVNGNVHAIAKYLGKLETYFERVRDGAERPELIALRQDLRLDHAVGSLRETVDSALEGAERVAEIVDNLRRFSADARGAPQSFDLVEIAQISADWVLKGARLQPRVEIAGEPKIIVEGRPGHIQQVLMNLYQNAADAAAEAGAASPIETRISVEDDMATIRVRDHGPGLAPEAETRLFDPFFTTKPVGQGTGLGLSISFKIVQEHGGRLTGRTHPEGGAEFEMRLPLKWRGGEKAGADV